MYGRDGVAALVKIHTKESEKNCPLQEIGIGFCGGRVLAIEVVAVYYA